MKKSVHNFRQPLEIYQKPGLQGVFFCDIFYMCSPLAMPKKVCAEKYVVFLGKVFRKM